MTEPSEQIVEKVLQWISHADEDLALAQHALQMSEGCPYRLVAYHAQQCAEKHLKAYLVHREVDFPYTHNITLLVELCSDTAEWADTLQDAEILTRYAMTTRYPGDDRLVSLPVAQRAIGMAVRVREAVRAALAEEGVDVP